MRFEPGVAVQQEGLVERERRDAPAARRPSRRGRRRPGRCSRPGRRRRPTRSGRCASTSRSCAAVQPLRAAASSSWSPSRSIACWPCAGVGQRRLGRDRGADAPAAPVAALQPAGSEVRTSAKAVRDRARVDGRAHPRHPLWATAESAIVRSEASAGRRSVPRRLEHADAPPSGAVRGVPRRAGRADHLAHQPGVTEQPAVRRPRDAVLGADQCQASGRRTADRRRPRTRAPCRRCAPAARPAAASPGERTPRPAPSSPSAPAYWQPNSCATSSTPSATSMVSPSSHDVDESGLAVQRRLDLALVDRVAERLRGRPAPTWCRTTPAGWS